MTLLKNFRRGFATNSSSSHSFVYLKEPNTSTSTSLPDPEFGWNDFRLDTLIEKLFYVLVDRIGTNGWETPPIAEVWEANKADFPEFDIEVFREAQEGYVDHQSCGTISLEEARDPHVVVFGGNDNSDGSVEREWAVRNGEIDWTRTVPSVYAEDLENAPEADKKVIAEFFAARDW